MKTNAFRYHSQPNFNLFLGCNQKYFINDNKYTPKIFIMIFFSKSMILNFIINSEK